MDNLASNRLFTEDGQDHEGVDLSDLIFANLDYRTHSRNVSFFRSDFSRSRFYDCSFCRNKFGRADFIDVYIKNTNFESVDFGSCLIKNAYFENVRLKMNNYHGVACQYSQFRNCVFRDELFVTNMYHCEFIECIFVNCRFEKSSLDCNTFSVCEFIKVDMSECIAANLRFDSCTLRDVFLCANLWIAYLYKNTDIQNFGFKYRGQIVDPWEGNSAKFINELLQKGLYFEYINAMIIGRFPVSDGLAIEIERIMPAIISQPNQIRKSTITKILDMLAFYFNYKEIALNDYIAIYTFLSNYSWENIPYEEQLLYQSKLYIIGKMIEQFDFDLSYIKTVSPNSICISKFHINTQDAELALSYLESAFKAANQDLCNSNFPEPLIQVIQQEKGSVILTIASATLLALFVSYAAKKIMHNLHGIQIEQSIKKQILKQIERPDAELATIQKGCSLAQKYDLISSPNDSEQLQKLSSELTKGEILGIILNLLF